MTKHPQSRAERLALKDKFEHKTKHKVSGIRKLRTEFLKDQETQNELNQYGDV